MPFAHPFRSDKMDPLGRFLKMALQDWIRDGGGSGPETILFVENGMDEWTPLLFFLERLIGHPN